MATLAAVNQLGESVAAMLRARRDLLAASGQLGALPAAFDISHLSASKVGAAPPTAGVSITCYQIAPSEHQRSKSSAINPADAASISVELYYLAAAWSASPAEEQAMVAWMMLELARQPVLDRSVLLGAGVWERDEIVQILPQALPPEQVFRVWDALGQRYRLSFTFLARVLRISYPPGPQWPPVVATRLGLADTDPLAQEEPA